MRLCYDEKQQPMYQQARRRQLYPMRTLPAQSPSVSIQSRTVIFFALFFFAVSGLISGFAVGAFVHPKGGSTSNSGPNTGTGKPVTQVTSTPTSRPKSHPVMLGYPVISPYTDHEKVDGSTIYIVSAQAVDQSKGSGHGSPVDAPDITCKLWLTKDGNVNEDIPHGRLLSVSTLDAPFPQEVEGGLNFVGTASQTQRSNANGQGNWQYSISPAIAPGVYYLVVLMDWDGIYYNWSWVQITIKKPN